MQRFCTFSGWRDVFHQYQGHLSEVSTDTYRNTHLAAQYLLFPTAKNSFVGDNNLFKYFSNC